MKWIKHIISTHIFSGQRSTERSKFKYLPLETIRIVLPVITLILSPPIKIITIICAMPFGVQQQVRKCEDCGNDDRAFPIFNLIY